MRLMQQPCHSRLRVLIVELNSGKIILAGWAKLCLDPIFIMHRIALEKVWRVSICVMHRSCGLEKNMKSAFLHITSKVSWKPA